MMEIPAMASVPFVALLASLGLPWLNTRRHHGGNPHAIASLIVLVLVLALVLWVFRRKPN